MKIYFKNNEHAEITSVVEQKVISNNKTGWMIHFTIKSNMTSTELDNLVTEENITKLKICSDNQNTETEIDGYSKIMSASVRYMDNASTVIDVQLSKNI